jgi:hypothetical protein
MPLFKIEPGGIASIATQSAASGADLPFRKSLWVKEYRRIDKTDFSALSDRELS